MADLEGMARALARRRRARRLSIASYVGVVLVVAVVVAFVPWPLAFIVFPLGLLVLWASDVVYERRRRAAIDAYEEASQTAG